MPGTAKLPYFIEECPNFSIQKRYVRAQYRGDVFCIPIELFRHVVARQTLLLREFDDVAGAEVIPFRMPPAG